MTERCAKCKKELFDKWQIGVTFEGLDRHHNPPEFTFEPGESWFGKMIYLCRNCHIQLHHQVIVPLLNNYVPTLKFNGSEYWLWMKLSPLRRKEARDLIYNKTEEWINNGNTNSR